MRGFGELECAADERDVRGGEVVPQVLGELRDLGHQPLGGAGIA